MKEEEIAFHVSNAYLRIKKYQSLTLRLNKTSYHGDPKDTAMIPVPPGKYKVIAVWSNWFGYWVRVEYKGTFHDLNPLDFSWYKEDQE